MPSYRDGWTVAKTDYMLRCPNGAKMDENEFY